ncbi:MAG: hypothetical protein A4E65_03816 [Syntrophorhabdus sp. PtaU1.Bin153]|nr:MAG: hypothetical protein A4E65_03816 [Syntrophorhabdus sp. PtaU1.Bin153]
MRVPAICDSCGAIFASGIEVENVYNTTFANCGAGPCPACGKMGHIPDGVYNFIDNTIELLSGPTRTISELERLARILTQARRERASLSEVERRIQQETPELSSLRNLFPKTRAELYSFISIILTIITLLLGQLKQNQVPKVEVAQVVNMVCQVQPGSPNSLMEHAAKGKKKVGRNDPCPCGSGKKYKKCCLNKTTRANE